MCPRRKRGFPASLLFCWRPRRDLNPCYRRESGMAKRNSNKLQEHGRTGWRSRNSRKHLIVSPMCPQREIGHSLKAAWVLPRRRETRNVVSALEKIGPLVSNLGFRSSTERFRSLAVVLQLSHSYSISSFKVFVSVSECQSQAWVQDWKQIEGEN